MPTIAAPRPQGPQYLSLFPCWEGRRPLGWFFAEQLLECRAASEFPTNSAGDDEDVNMYLVALLQRWATSDPDSGVEMGADPLLRPHSSGSRRVRADHWRRQADHRLLALGLFDRGDLIRRRRVGWRMTAAETRQRDLTVLVRGYSAAADLLQGCCGTSGQVTVWRKLAAHGDSYVHVIQTLARRRLGLGARLREADLARLMAGA